MHNGIIVLGDWVVRRSIILGNLFNDLNRIAPVAVILGRSIGQIVSARESHSGSWPIRWAPKRPHVGVVCSRVECCPDSMCRTARTSDYAYLAHAAIGVRSFYHRLNIILLPRIESRVGTTS